MENIIHVNADSRKEVGKSIAKKLRQQERIPAIIYGGGRDTIPISLLLSDIKNILKSEMGENTILRIHREDIQVDAMLKEVQYDYLSDNIIHADFIRIDLEKTIEVNVPVVIIGESVGVKIEDGIFDFISREIRVRSLPAKIPKEIVVNVEDLHIGQSIKLEDLDVAEDVEILSDPQTTICAVSVKGAVEEEVVEEIEEEEGEVAEDEEGAEAEGKDKEKLEDEDKKKEEPADEGKSKSQKKE